MTPLHYACMGGSERCAKLLLESDCNVGVNAKDISGCTPLLYCLNNKSRSMEKVCVCVCVRVSVVCGVCERERELREKESRFLMCENL